jgi:DNA-binding transcriptional LysR family regulator
VPRYYFKELRLQQFRGLVALSQWQTFTAAAMALGLTRASVWQQVHGLEREMESTLVRPNGHRVELTEAGRRLVEIVTPLIAGFDSVKSAFQSALAEQVPSIRIASAPEYAAGEVTWSVARLREIYPRLSITFLEQSSEVALDMLERGNVSVAIAAVPENEPGRPSLECIPFAAYPLTLVCPPDHALLRKKQIELRDIARQPLLLPVESSSNRRRINAVFGRASLLQRMNVALESEMPATQFEYVRRGLGIAIVPLPGDIDCLRAEGLSFRSVADIFGEETISYIRRRGEFETPCAAKFRELVLMQPRRREESETVGNDAVPFDMLPSTRLVAG